MKISAALLCSMIFWAQLSAQQSAKKYVLIEHFTNSKCSICANKNPAFYSLIGQAQYADEVHHIAIHPSFPYNTCVFYQANTSENTAWTNLYPGVQGTPTIVINGALQNPSSPLLSEAKLQPFLNQTSPLSLQVTEGGTNAARTVQVKATALGDIPAGNYKIFVAIAEKTINQVTPNGEAVHRDVFRKMLTAVEGDAFTAPSLGNSTNFNYTFSIPNNWNADEVYALAFVKEVDTKLVLNSGTRFDPILSGVGEATIQTIRILPNPALDWAWIELPSDRARLVEVFASNGQRVSVAFEASEKGLSIPINTLTPGIYFVKITGEKGAYTGKFVKG